MARDAGYGIFVSTKTELEVIEWDQGWEYMQRGFTKLKRILEGLSESQFTSEENMMLYTTIYNMCTQKPPYDYSWQLYIKHREVLEEYITSTVLPSLREKHNEFLLLEFVERWATHKVMIKWLSFFFNYLDRFFVSRRSLPRLKEVGLTCFRDLIYGEVKDNVRVAVMNIINKERDGEQIDVALLKNVINMFVEMGRGQANTYEQDFEAPMLEDTREYYSRKASSWILEDSFPDYLLKADECLRREKDRVSHYLPSISEQKLMEKVQFELLVVYGSKLLENDCSGCCALLRDDKVEDLSMMYRLYHKIPEGLEPVARLFRQHVITEGTTLVQRTENAPNDQASIGYGFREQVLVREIAQLHDKYTSHVNDCFLNHSSLLKALKDAFDVICNKFVAGISSAELLVALCDNILKTGGGEKLGDDAMEETLEKVVKLLPYIRDKNLFAEFYRKKLARRLLFNQCANEDLEKSTLAKLKQQCGGQFTSKMEGMVTDLTLARENRTGFEEYLHSNPSLNPGMDLTVTVLTTGFWPSYKSFDLNLPAEMVNSLEVFKGFYETKAKNRKLTWIYSLGTCNIIGKFEPKVIELVVSTYQAAILLLFNNVDRWNYSEIYLQLNLNHEDLARVLLSLSCSKYKILLKEPNTKSILPTDNFEFNSKFTHKMRRIKIPLPPVDERKEVIEDVDKDKRFAIDAAVVRIMKSRKALRHHELVVECVEQLQHMFKPDIRAIKKRIEDLIARDYLERDKEHLNMVRYLT